VTDQFAEHVHLLRTLEHESGFHSMVGLDLHEDPIVRPHFVAADDLIQFLHSAKPPGPMGGRRDAEAWPKEAILWSSLYRSMKTHRAVLALCSAGYGEQAGMLCRSLFEDLLVTHWMKRTAEADLQRRFREHQERVELADREALAEHGRDDVLAVMPPVSPERLAELEATGGAKPSFKTWHGQNLRGALLPQLQKELGPLDGQLLDAMHDLAYRMQNLLLHHSPRAIEHTVGMSLGGSAAAVIAQRHGGEVGTGVTLITSKPGPGYVLDAMRSAYFSVSRQALAVIPSAHEAELRRRIDETRHLVVYLPPGVSAGRNDPCPCGSGRKYKRCHGQ
jgi:hypothetical protein